MMWLEFPNGDLFNLSNVRQLRLLHPSAKGHFALVAQMLQGEDQLLCTTDDQRTLMALYKRVADGIREGKKIIRL